MLEHIPQGSQVAFSLNQSLSCVFLEEPLKSRKSFRLTLLFPKTNVDWKGSRRKKERKC